MGLFNFLLLTSPLLQGIGDHEKYKETLYSQWGQSFEISEIIHQETSDFWDLIIFENPIFGKVLAIDGAIQLTEADEQCYHEMMAHAPLS